jgi:hypothetical protein
MGNKDKNKTINDIPDYLKRWPGLYIREGDRIITAPADDQSVAQRYPWWPDKGPITEGRRLTIMTKKTTYLVNEEVRIIHVFEATEPGTTVYVMGPKPVLGEYVDGQRATDLPPEWEDPLEPSIYDGRTLPSPAVDYNFDITTYVFAEPGSHEIHWKLGPLKSNVLRLEIIEAESM